MHIIQRKALCVIYLGFIMPLTKGCIIQSKQFESIITIPTGPIKDQKNSGLCWSFATTSFIESEAIRLKRELVSISPVYYVPFAYKSKSITYINQNGKTYFGNGGLTFSVMDGYNQLGAIPDDLYQQLYTTQKPLEHDVMDLTLKNYIKKALQEKYDVIKVNKEVDSIIYRSIPAAPDSFLYKGVLYTPKKFAEEFIGINTGDYIEVTSFSHLPFYKYVTLEVPANWNKKKYLNLPLSEFMDVVDSALYKGHSLCWDGDATESKFNFQKGILELPTQQEDSEITQVIRQDEYIQKRTTEDHNMHLIGIATDQNKKLHYIMKNSEGINKRNGYVYMTKNAFLLKTISIMVNRNVIPASIIKKIK